MRQSQEDERRAREAKAILDRVTRETEPQTGAFLSGLTSRAGRHLGAGDKADEDRIEIIGTRIGRLLSVGAFVVLGLMLAAQLLTP